MIQRCRFRDKVQTLAVGQNEPGGLSARSYHRVLFLATNVADLWDDRPVVPKEVDFDEVLEDVGEFGFYHKLLFFGVLLPSFIPCGIHAYNQIFMQTAVDHWCRVPELDAENLTMKMQKKIA